MRQARRLEHGRDDIDQVVVLISYLTFRFDRLGPRDRVSLSYGANQRATNFRLATYADRILRGETPADIPVEQPTNFELVVNLSTAKALRIEVPKSILLRADRVIE